MTTIDTLAYKIIADTQGFTRGLMATRQEIAAAKELLRESVNSWDLYQAKLQAVEQLQAKGLLSSEQYAAAMNRLNAQSPEAVQRQQELAEMARRLAAAESEAAAVVARHRTEREKYTEAVQRLAALKAGGQFSGESGQRTYTAELERLKGLLPEVQAKQMAQAAAEREAADIVARHRTERERYDAALQRLVGMKSAGLFSGEAGQRAYLAELERLRGTLPEVQAQQQAAAAAADKHAAALHRAKQLTADAETPFSRYRSAVHELSQLKSQGALTAAEYSKALRGVRAELASNLPLLGGMAKLLVSQGWMQAGIVATAAVAAYRHVSAQVSVQSAEVERLAKSSKLLGLDVNTLQVWERFGSRAGASVDTVGEKIGKFVEKLGGMRAGGKDLDAAIGALGLDKKRLANASVDDALRMVAERFAGITNAADRAYLAEQLFGRGGDAMLPALTAGAAGLDEMRSKLAALGLTLTVDQVESVQRAKRAWSEMRHTLDGTWRTLAVQLAPTIEHTARTLSEEFARPENQAAMKQMAADLAEFGRAAIDVGVALGPVVAATGRMAGMSLQGWAAIGRLFTRGTLLEDSGEADRQAVQARIERERAEQRARARSAMTGQQLETYVGGRQTAAVADEVKSLNSELAKQAESLLRTTAAQRIAALAARGATSEQLREATAWEKLIASRRQANAAADKLRSKTEELASSHRQAIETFGLSAEAVKMYELRMAGATAETLRAIAAAKSHVQSLEAQKQLTEKTAEAGLQQWQTQRQAQLQAAGFRGPGGQTAAERAAEETAELRRQRDLMQLVARLRQEGSSEEDIRRQVAIRQQADAIDRQSQALTRRQRLLESGRQAEESVRSPEEAYAEQLRHIREMMDAGGMSVTAYVRLRKRAAEELARALPGGDRRRGVAAFGLDSAEGQDQIFEMRRAMAALRKQAQIDAQVAAEAHPKPALDSKPPVIQEPKPPVDQQSQAVPAPLTNADRQRMLDMDPLQQSAEMAGELATQTAYQSRMVAALERLERQETASVAN